MSQTLCYGKCTTAGCQMLKVMVPEACEEAVSTTGQCCHSADSDGGATRVCARDFFNSYIGMRKGSPRKTPVLAQCNGREGSGRSKGGGRGASEKDNNTQQKWTTCMEVPQPLNRAMVYDYLA